MEQQNGRKSNDTVVFPNDFQILQLIETTYQSQNTSEIQQAEARLNSLLKVDLFIEKLFSFLQNQEQLNIKNSQQFKMAVSIQIKKFSYQYAKKQNANKELFVQKLFCLLLVSKLKAKSKQQLGTALQYVLNHDIECQYKPKIVQKITQILQSEPADYLLQGTLIISVACLNSLIEAEDQLNFMWTILDPLIKNAALILQILKKQPIQNLVMEDSKRMLKLSRRLFDLIELAISRILDEEDYIEQKINELRDHTSLQLLFFSFLVNFGYKKSILSTVPEVNSVKEIVVEIIFGLYKNKPMPENIFNLFFITLLLQAEKQTYQQEQEHIVTRILEMLQSYLEDKFYYQTFMDHKMQLMMSILMYSVTKPEEFDMIEDQPERFVQLSEQFTQGFKGSTNVKVRAASFLRVFTSKFDQALRNILQILVIIITANMESDDPQSPCLQLYHNLQQQFPQFPFFKLDVSLQLQTCFSVMSLLSVYITKRQDLNKIVYAILITHFNKFQTIQKPIVLLRLVRLIGYYPTAVYYNMIKLKMSLGKVFVMEGLKAFQRILKANRYPQIFEVLAELFSELINVIKVNDSIFQSIILNHYERILKKNVVLFDSFLMKIRDTFVQNIQKSQHLSFICLSYIYSMLNKQNDMTDAKYRNSITQYFYSMEEYHSKIVEFYFQKLLQNNASLVQDKKILQTMENYEQKIIDIYNLIIKKQVKMSDRMIHFSINKLKTIGTHNRNAQIFRLYNNLFLKVDNEFDNIGIFYSAFMSEIRSMFSSLIEGNESMSPSNTHKLQILPNLSYLVSQIFACFYQFHLSKEDLVWMLKILSSVTEDVKQYILLIILSYGYVQPVKLKEILQQQNLYEDTLKFLLTTSYNQKLIRKIFLLSMTKLLEIEQKYFEDIIRQCIKYFKEQFQQNETKKLRKQYVDPKLRRMFNQNEVQDEEEMTQQKQKGNSTTSFPQFKHPFSALSEYDQFKIRVWQNFSVIDRLNQNDKNELRQILQMDWFGKGVRKIVSVKQPLNKF